MNQTKDGLLSLHNLTLLNVLGLFYPTLEFSFLHNLFFQQNRALKLSICH